MALERGIDPLSALISLCFQGEPECDRTRFTVSLERLFEENGIFYLRNKKAEVLFFSPLIRFFRIRMDMPAVLPLTPRKKIRLLRSG